MTNAEMWGKLGAVLDSVSHGVQYAAAERYAKLWYTNMRRDLAFDDAFILHLNVQALLSSTAKRVNA